MKMRRKKKKGYEKEREAQTESHQCKLNVSFGSPPKSNWKPKSILEKISLGGSVNDAKELKHLEERRKEGKERKRKEGKNKSW